MLSHASLARVNDSMDDRGELTDVVEDFLKNKGIPAIFIQTYPRSDSPELHLERRFLNAIISKALASKESCTYSLNDAKKFNSLPLQARSSLVSVLEAVAAHAILDAGAGAKNETSAIIASKETTTDVHDEVSTAHKFGFFPETRNHGLHFPSMPSTTAQVLSLQFFC
jgi:hypothetical protein